ncbi:hypothetical protein DB88DRAFT_479058 [Papiliotrema laurentii]|uniref:Uncharacterized protein n=1 Tax=Papiliotrema laurentii TaxID=5418 RepID=A0AAD9FXB0_PAPLA|nr:hypothetical protein DB88DRAFT_479058 [Papiliotrema laurentii]
MFRNAKRSIAILWRTPLVPPPAGPPALEMTSFAAGPSRPRSTSRTFSNMSVKSAFGYSTETPGRRYASDKGKKELYSDESGSTGAGIDDVAHTDAAFNSDPNPSSAAKGVEKETGKDFTKRSPANADVSKPPGKQGEPRANDEPLRTSKTDAKNH